MNEIIDEITRKPLFFCGRKVPNFVAGITIVQLYIIGLAETVFSWGMVLVLLIVAFRLLSRYQQRRHPIKAITMLLHAICVSIALVCNVVLTALLYEPVVASFDVNMDGFMSLNGLLTFAIIWSAICLLSLVVVVKADALFGIYYRTLRAAQMIFLLTPLLFVFIFLFVTGLK